MIEGEFLVCYSILVRRLRERIASIRANTANGSLKVSVLCGFERRSLALDVDCPRFHTAAVVSDTYIGCQCVWGVI